MKFALNFFKQFDNFVAWPSLRANQIPLVSNLCTGIFSFILFGLVATFFIANVVSIVNYEKVNTVQTSSLLPPQLAKAKDIFFAINVHMLNKTEMMDNFNITLYFISGSRSPKVQLGFCKAQQIKVLGDNFRDIYKAAGLSEFLCPVDNSYLNIQSQGQQAIQLIVSPCLQSINPQCTSKDAQYNLIKKYQKLYGFMTLNLYFMDKSLASNKRVALYSYLNPIPVFWFSTTLGSYGTIFLGTYQVSTDTNLLPFESWNQETGTYVADYNGGALVRKTNQTQYGRVVIYLGSKLIVVKRIVGKLDQSLSYIGGLYEIIISLFMIFLISFNEQRYEIMIAQSMFNFSQSGDKVKQTDFNFFTYCKYMVFDWVTLICCYQMEWDDCRKITSTRDQVNNQIDVNRLFRKIQYIETAALYRMNQGQSDFLALAQPDSIQEVQRSRRLLGYYDQIIKGKAAVTLFDIKQQILQDRQNGKQQQQQPEQRPYRSNQKKKYKKNNPRGPTKRKVQQTLTYTQIYEQAVRRYPVTFVNSLDIDLTQQYYEIEDELIQSYNSLSQTTKQKVLMTVPINILFRLGQQEQVKDEDDQQNQLAQQVIKHRRKQNMARRMEIQDDQELEQKDKNINIEDLVQQGDGTNKHESNSQIQMNSSAYSIQSRRGFRRR